MSIDAFQDSVSDVWPTLEMLRPPGADGGVVSPEGAQALVEPETLAGVDALPAASRATTERVWAVPQVSPLTVNDVLDVEPTALDPSETS